MRTAFEQNFAENLEAKAQLTIFKDGVKVVDLHGHSGSTGTGDDYDGDTLQNIFSSGKNLEAIACMILVDRGQLNYKDKISDKWPEFGQFGKENITVEDLLRHEAGLQFFSDPDHLGDFKKVKVPTIADVEGTKNGDVEKTIEGCAAWGHSKRMYHASTRGFVVAGLVRQITGKTLGEFVREEIVNKLSPEVNLHVGATLEEQAKNKYAPMQKCSTSWTLLKEVLPSMFGLKSANDETYSMFKVILSAIVEKNSPLLGYAKAIPKEWEEGEGDHVHASTPEGRTLEVSSGGVQANARSLGYIAGCWPTAVRLEGIV